MKILSFGFGSIAQRHVTNIIKFAHVEYIFVLNSSTNCTLTIRPGYEFLADRVTVTQSVEDLLSRIDGITASDLVIIASPSSLHVNHLMMVVDRLLSYNLTIFPKILVEKPLCTIIDDLNILKNIPSSLQKKISVVSQLRAQPLYSIVKELVINEKYGKLQHVSISTHEHISLWHGWESYASSYAAKKALGGGCLLTQMHDLELFTSICGFPLSSFILKGDGHDLNIDCDDYYLVSMTNFPNHIPRSASVATSYYCKQPSRMHSYFFEDGNLFLDFTNSCYTLVDSTQRIHSHIKHERNQMYSLIAQEIVSGIPTKSTSGIVPFRESLRFHEWLISL